MKRIAVTLFLGALVLLGLAVPLRGDGLPGQVARRDLATAAGAAGREAAAAGARPGRLRSGAVAAPGFAGVPGRRGLARQAQPKGGRLAVDWRRTVRRLDPRLVLPGGAVALAVAFAAIFAWWRWWRRFRAAVRFPATQWRVRLGAPFAGGNDAVARLGGERPRR